MSLLLLLLLLCVVIATTGLCVLLGAIALEAVVVAVGMAGDFVRGNERGGY